MSDNQFTYNKSYFFAAACKLCRNVIDRASLGNLAVGFVLGVGSLVAIAEVYGESQKGDINQAATQFAADPSQINQTFSKTGNGLVGVDIDGRKCVINIDRSLGNPDLYFTACLPQ